ncbi:MAG: DUF6446 family protein [Pseudomonadota bacterium]
MTGKALVLALILSAVVAGVGMYYLQIYGYYYEVEPSPGEDVVLLAHEDETSQPIEYTEFRAIDADSSPIRYRACFETDLTLDELTGDYVLAQDVTPLTAPNWFDCYDAVSLAEALKSGQAKAFVGIKNVHYGVDRIVAITQAGQGFAWHVLNNCGEKAYDGTVVGEDCPPRPES